MALCSAVGCRSTHSRRRPWRSVLPAPSPAVSRDPSDRCSRWAGNPWGTHPVCPRVESAQGACAVAGLAVPARSGDPHSGPDAGRQAGDADPQRTHGWLLGGSPNRGGRGNSGRCLGGAGRLGCGRGPAGRAVAAATTALARHQYTDNPRLKSREWDSVGAYRCIPAPDSRKSTSSGGGSDSAVARAADCRRGR